VCWSIEFVDFVEFVESVKHQTSHIVYRSGETSTINHQPSTINHQPSTINHQPSTINHQPSTIVGSHTQQVQQVHLLLEGVRCVLNNK
jgi:hypothetical protein